MIRSPAAAVLLVALIAATGCGTVQPDERISREERSLSAESMGDSLLAGGMDEAAREAYLRAALLRLPGDVSRIELAWKAARASDSPSLLTANLLLESPDSLAPYAALRLGGASIAPALRSHVSRYGCVMPEYLFLVLADSLVEAGEAETALDVLKGADGGLPKRASDRRTLLRYRAFLENGRPAEADSLFSQVERTGDYELLSLLCHYRGSWMLASGIPGHRDLFLRSFALWPAAPVHSAAYGILREEILADGSFGGSLTDDFYSGGLWNELVDIAVNSTDPDPHLWYLAARTRDRLGFYEEAASMLQEYIDRWPGGSDAPDALINLGRNLGRLGDHVGGIEVLQRYGSEFPGHFRAGNLPWYIGDLLVNNRMWEEAIPWFRMTLQRYPGNTTADDAHFYIFYCLMKTGDISGALAELEDFIVRWPGSTYISSARYWQGRLLLEQGDTEGRVILEQLVRSAPYSLPAFFARELLGISRWEPLFTEEPLGQWMERHAHSPADPPPEACRGLFLIRAGLRHLAMGEFLRAEDMVGGPDRLAPFYLENDVWERRPISGYRMWDLSGSEYDRPRELWMLRYQTAWPEYVLPEAFDAGMDPLFIWAIIRNESMFQPDCYSVAGARGLIQMIPSTSEYVAVANGWDDYSPDRLYDPEVSIRYGVTYISEVSAEKGGDPVRTAAAYNGGPHNAVHWGSQDMGTEEFFSLITFNETRAYTQNVHHAYMIYRSLYGDLFTVPFYGTGYNN